MWRHLNYHATTGHSFQTADALYTPVIHGTNGKWNDFERIFSQKEVQQHNFWTFLPLSEPFTRTLEEGKGNL